jgi:hypothetical protein
MHDDFHKMTLPIRALSWALDVVEQRIALALPRGTKRRTLLARIDRARVRWTRCESTGSSKGERDQSDT